MKYYKAKNLPIILMALIMLTGCNNFLEEKVYTEYDPSALLSDESGVSALLAGAYARSRIVQYDSRNYTYLFNEFCTDVAFESGAALSATPRHSLTLRGT